jgi:hypothetical protein
MWKYKPGTTNVVVDALSRHDIEGESSLAALSAPEFMLFDDIRQGIDSNDEL